MFPAICIFLGFFYLIVKKLWKSPLSTQLGTYSCKAFAALFYVSPFLLLWKLLIGNRIFCDFLSGLYYLSRGFFRPHSPSHWESSPFCFGNGAPFRSAWLGNATLPITSSPLVLRVWFSDRSFFFFFSVGLLLFFPPTSPPERSRKDGFVVPDPFVWRCWAAFLLLRFRFIVLVACFSPFFVVNLILFPNFHQPVWPPKVKFGFFHIGFLTTVSIKGSVPWKVCFNPLLFCFV